MLDVVKIDGVEPFLLHWPKATNFKQELSASSFEDDNEIQNQGNGDQRLHLKATKKRDSDQRLNLGGQGHWRLSQMIVGFKVQTLQCLLYALFLLLFSTLSTPISRSSIEPYRTPCCEDPHST